MKNFYFEPSMKAQWAHGKAKFANPEFPRRGESWTLAERAHVYAGYMHEGLGIPQLARRHGRAPEGIAAQLEHILQPLGAEDKSLLAAISNYLTAEAAPTVKIYDARVEVVLQPPPLPPQQGKAGQPVEAMKAAARQAGSLGNLISFLGSLGFPYAMAAGGGTEAPRHGESTPPAPHPNKEMICAFAEGRRVQWSPDNKNWIAYDALGTHPPLGATQTVKQQPLYWRVKPVLDTRPVHIRMDSKGEFAYISRSPGRAPNAVLEFTNGELTDVKYTRPV